MFRSAKEYLMCEQYQEFFGRLVNWQPEKICYKYGN